MSEVLQRALTAVELREAELLSWGAVGAEWRHDELVGVLDEHGDGENILAEMVEKALIVRTQTDGYRSRSAETIRLLATLRQAFRQENVLQGRPLVLDYRFLQRPRRRPLRKVAANEVLAGVGDMLGSGGRVALQVLLPPSLSAFQVQSTREILTALDSSNPTGIVVSAGTGTGKTLAFYMPVLTWICDQTTQQSGVTALALYPRNELLKDQLWALVSYVLDVRGVGGAVSLATWFGSTPRSAHHVRQGWERDWRPVASGYVCPYLRCPEPNCGEGAMVWPQEALKNDIELLRCSQCGIEIHGDVLRLTRESARDRPARIMLSTTESLNRQLSSPGNLRAFGVSDRTLRVVLLDEAHTYEGTTGAQNAYLFRRLRTALGYEPLWAGLSATLADAGEFFSRLVDIDSGRITVVEPDLGEFEESGAEYLVALRHNPHGNAGTLSTTIQTAMALSRALDPMVGNPFNPPVDSNGILGSRVFAFTDKLDSTNRLYWDLLDAEGWAWPGSPKQGANPLTLAHLRSREQVRLARARREDPAVRDVDGQYWWLAEGLGHEVDGDVQKHVGRTSSQDSGVASDAEIVVATASLEVGFDDDRVGAVLQHKAPHEVAQFLQRKGRGGRNSVTRPWTVVVLSDWGRDREAWDAYDALFSPVVPRRTLPLENLYVLRIQAVYSLLDWLANELDYGTNSTWADSAGPAALLTSKPAAQATYRARQERMASLLSALLRDGTERASLIRHLRRSLCLGRGQTANTILEKLLWEAPRPLLGSVVPTLRRRLMDQWGGELPAEDDAAVRTRTPLREFVPGNLFDELLVPDVEFQVPWARNEMQVEHLPALRAMGEFLPGNVSRHFGVWATNKRHWVPLPSDADGDGAHLVDVATYGGTAIDDLVTASGTIRVFTPRSVVLEAVPYDVSDASSMRAEWVFNASQLGVGTRLPIPSATANLFESLTAHLHSQGDGVRILRYASVAHGVLWVKGRSTPNKIHFGIRNGEEWGPAALGVEVHADAIHGRVAIPQFEATPTPAERTEWLRESIVGDQTFPEDLSTFDRRSLADAVETFAASWDWSVGEPNSGEFGNGVQRAALLLGLVDRSNPGMLTRWLADDTIIAALQRHVVESRAQRRSDAWVDWLGKQFTLSAAESLLATLATGNGNVDPDDLLIDLDHSDRGAFYISEQSPGGTGQVESLALDHIEQPERLPTTLANVLRPTDTELLDQQLRLVIASQDTSVESAVANLAESWRRGHEAVRQATGELDRALNSADIAIDHPAKTALSTRLAGPGAAPRFLDEVRHWLSVRDAHEQRSGMAVEPRALATLLASRAEVDGYLQLENPTEMRRSQAIANVLWPWGLSARANGAFNPYSDVRGGSIDLLRRHWRMPVEVVEFEEWTDERRSEAHRRLLESGQVLLRVPAARRHALRAGIVDLHTAPVEVGPLWCYPKVLGVHERGSLVETRLVLRETW